MIRNSLRNHRVTRLGLEGAVFLPENGGPVDEAVQNPVHLDQNRLLAVIEAWPRLSEEVRQQIVNLVSDALARLIDLRNP
jgi:hypothetical protein